ncbi:unnamed protein product [Didymodactylos carnosus]|uniref:Uncharacterized protein n=1 Tax=Didymodactylos carnosus TaxID=1234261 RepID=A0A8S2Q1N4_9BILA|nr:unnamed protein product [Didymodactylos carnosus]CAF4079774.1 unnamed protein product [Didymodactylos carnosus]
METEWFHCGWRKWVWQWNQSTPKSIGVMYVDDDQTIYIADPSNHRIAKWQWGATSGQVVAGGNGQGSGTHQLSDPLDVIVDKERDSHGQYSDIIILALSLI